MAVSLLYNLLLTLILFYSKDDYDLCAACFECFGKEAEYTKIDMPVPRHPRDFKTVILLFYISYFQYTKYKVQRCHVFVHVTLSVTIIFLLISAFKVQHPSPALSSEGPKDALKA